MDVEAMLLSWVKSGKISINTCSGIRSSLLEPNYAASYLLRLWVQDAYSLSWISSCVHDRHLGSLLLQLVVEC